MLKRASLVKRVGSRPLVLAVVLLAGLAAPSAASATITSVFGGKVACETKTTGAEAGQRWCGNASNTTVTTWDGTTPIDVSVAFPPAASPDSNYPVVGIYHGWGGSKITPSSAQAQRWLKLGYAVFSMSDRGWGYSCGVYNKSLAACKTAGFIHLLSRRYEVRDAQFLLGELADEGVINPQEIGANGGSYGGGMSLQLGSLKDRVELTTGELIPWTSPGGKAMKIAATAPEYPWSDLAQALQPNGSTLDYVAEAPYSGMLGNHEYGIEKQNWNETLYNAGALLGYYEATPAEPEAALTEWHTFNSTGGPYYEIVSGKAKPKPLAAQQETQLQYHGAYYTNLSEAPAPALIENGWNDDLFTVNESVDYYNKVRASYPSQPIKLFYFDYGHNPRSATSPSTSESAAFQAAQNEWFAHYIKGEGAEPANAAGGVTAITSACSAETTATGVTYEAADWARLAAGEVNLQGAAEQTIAAPGTAPKAEFISGTVCSTEAAGENASAATYKLAAASAGGYTIAGSPTVIAELSTPIRNDQVIARLMDEEPSGKQRLIGRAIYRPINPEGGFTKQAFQLHPQAWKVEAGHVLKLQLMIKDAKYARNSSSTTSSAASIAVKNLELRIPTIDAPGSAGGLVEAPRAKYLPAGYTLARNVTPAAPGAPALTSGTTPDNTGVFTLGWEASQAASALTYTLQAKSNGGSWTTVASGLTSPEYAFTSGSPEAEGTWTYRVSASNEGPASEYSSESSSVVVDQTAPNAPTASTSRAPDYAGGGGWFKGSVEVSFAANGDPNLSDASPGSGVNTATLSHPVTVSSTEEACGTVADNAGNVSAKGCITVQIDNTPPSLSITCPATAVVGEAAEATFSASDTQSGLASASSGTVPIDTSSAGKKTVSTTAVDNVGNEVTESCSTEVGYSSPGKPVLSAGSSPNDNGLFTLSWTGPNPLTYMGLSYTLEHRSYDTGWSPVAVGIQALSYQFTGAGEQEGTWEYRVEGTDAANSLSTGLSPDSSPVVVDETAPNAPSATASRPPDYSGGGGWYKNSVEVSFGSEGDPALSDGSPGSGVNPASVATSQTVSSSGTHHVCDTAYDYAGNPSATVCTTVQVDATPPSVSVACPATAVLGSSGVSAKVTASDAYSGLKVDPSGSVPISTASVGDVTVTRTAESNVGLTASSSCTTDVGYGFEFKPNGWPASKEFYPGYGVSVAFALSNSAGKAQSGASAVLEVAKVTGGVVGTYSPATPQNSSYTGDHFKAGSTKGQYVYKAKDTGFAAGTWDLRVSLSDGSTHVVSITII